MTTNDLSQRTPGEAWRLEGALGASQDESGLHSWDSNADWFQREEKPAGQPTSPRKAGDDDGYTIQARQDPRVLAQLHACLEAQLSSSTEHNSGDHQEQ